MSLTHPYSIFIWQRTKGDSGRWAEPVQAYTQEYGKCPVKTVALPLVMSGVRSMGTILAGKMDIMSKCS